MPVPDAWARGMRTRLRRALEPFDYQGVPNRLGDMTVTGHGVEFQITAARTIDDLTTARHDLAAALNRAKERGVLKDPKAWAVAAVDVREEFGIPGFGHIEVLHSDPLWDSYPYPYDPFTPPIAGPEEPVPFAVDRHGNELTIPLVGDAGAANLLIFGARGSGKSNGLNVILRQMIPQPFVRAYLIDMKGGMEFNRWKPYAFDYATTESEALAMWQNLRSRVDTKAKELVARGVGKVTRFDETDLYDLVVVDEGALQFKNEKLATLCAEVLWLCRAVGIGVIMAMQQPTVDVIPSFIRDAGFDMRMSYRLMGGHQASSSALGEHVPEHVAPHLIGMEEENRGLVVAHSGYDWRLWKTYENDYGELDELCAS